jgi:hypothetical protein
MYPIGGSLSYVWGNINVTREIRCGKERSSITLSLHEALVYIRNRRTPRLLWVDSLCINQSDKEEKGHQVQRMHLVYGQELRQKAEMTCVLCCRSSNVSTT